MATTIKAPIANTTTTTEEGGGCHPDEKKRYEDWGIPYCNKCCNPMATDVNNQPICRLGEPDTCPLIQA